MEFIVRNWVWIMLGAVFIWIAEAIVVGVLLEKRDREYKRPERVGLSLRHYNLYAAAAFAGVAVIALLGKLLVPAVVAIATRLG